MPTTAGGLPYPALSDSPNGPAAIQALAEGVDTKVHRNVVDANARTALTGIVAGTTVSETNTGRLYLKTASGWNYVGGGVISTDIAFTPFVNQYGWTARSGAGFEVRNGWCSVNLNLTQGSWPAGVNIYQLPIGARPARSFYSIANWAGSIRSEIQALTSGWLIATNSGVDGIVGTFSFPVA